MKLKKKFQNFLIYMNYCKNIFVNNKKFFYNILFYIILNSYFIVLLYYLEKYYYLFIYFNLIIFIFNVFLFYFYYLRKKSNDIIYEENNVDFIYDLLHDLKSPLSNLRIRYNDIVKISNELDELILKKQCLEDCEFKDKIDNELIPEIKDTMIFLDKNVNRLESMIDGVFEFYRTNKKKLNIQEVNIKNIITDLLQELYLNDKKINGDSKNILAVCDNLPIIKCDKKMMIRVFENLISNSYKYKEKNRPLNIFVTCEEYKRNYLFKFIDNGIGILKGNENKIFNILFRENNYNNDGDGMGLPIVKKIINMHNGNIWCSNNEKHGITIFFTLPK